EKIQAIARWVTQYGSETRADEVRWFLKTTEPKIHAHVCDEFENGALNGHKWMSVRSGGSARMPQVELTHKTHLLINYRMSKPGGSFVIRKGSLHGPVIASVALTPADDARVIDIPLQPVTGKHDLYFVFDNPRIDKNESVCTIE